MKIKSLCLNDDDYAKFKEIKGLEELNYNESRMIKIINSNVFTNEKKSDNEQCYISGGIVEEYKIPNQRDENFIVLDKSKKMKIGYLIVLLYFCINILKNAMNYLI